MSSITDSIPTQCNLSKHQSESLPGFLIPSKTTQYVYNILELEDRFARKYITIPHQERYSITNVHISNKTCKSVCKLMTDFHENNDHERTPMKCILNDLIAKKSVATLFGHHWLTDEVINFCFKLFNLRSHLFARTNGSKPDFLSSYFMTKLIGPSLDLYNPSACQQQIRAQPFNNLFNGYRKIMVPLNDSKLHWTLLVIDFF